MDFRVAAYLEAGECLKLVKGQDISQPEFWANLLGAIANAAIASVPDSVATQAEPELGRREQKQRELQKRVQKDIKKKLDK